VTSGARKFVNSFQCRRQVSDCHIPQIINLISATELTSVSSTGSPEIPGFHKRESWILREMRICDGGRLVLGVLNLYVLIKIRVATIDTNQSVTDSTQSNAASIQKLPDSVVKSVSQLATRQSMCQTKPVGYRSD